MEAFRNLSQLVRAVTLSPGGRVSLTQHVPTLLKIRGRFGGEISAKMSSQASESSYPLTKEEAFTYLESHLGIPHSQIDTGGKSLDFLNRVIKEMSRSIPFTNMNLLTKRPVSSLKPEDWKNHIMSGQGGTCRWNNPFMKALLERLGYTSLQIPGNEPVVDRNNQAHISTLVCDVSYPGSRHLVESGTRWPLSEAIPLDFDTESPEYTFYQLKSKFFKSGNDLLQFCTPASCEVPDKQVINDTSGAKWQIRIEYWLNERTDWMEFNKSYIQRHEIHNIPIRKPFGSFLFYGFLKEKRVSIVCSDGRIQAKFYNMEDHTTERKLMTKTEFLDFFVNHYPQYLVHQLEKVCEISNLS